MSALQAPPEQKNIGATHRAETQLHPLPTEQFSLRRKLRSLFLVALALYVLLNGVLYFYAPCKFDPYNYAYKGWAWWVLDDLRHSPDVHNVAFLGSSLIVSAVAGCDANYLNKQLDLTKYHHVTYMEDKLRTEFGGDFNCFNLSAPGQMPSDAYLHLKAMVQTANRPDVVFYGIAPRDFIDSTLSGPNDTEPFRYLTRIVNIDDVMNAEFRSLWSKLDWGLGRIDYLYNYALDFQLWTADTVRQVLNKYMPAPFTPRPFTYWDRIRILPAYCPGEIYPSAVVAGPLNPNKIDFKDNTKEYQARYRKPDPRTYRTQMYFLRKLAEYCHKERIELVLINMPIMQYNVCMLPSGVYARYLKDMHEFAWNHDVLFYDLCEFSKYSQKDFHDTVHLNGFGARKLFDNLVQRLVGDKRASTELSLSGMQLEKHKALAAEPRATY